MDFINATAICANTGRAVSDWRRLKQTRELIKLVGKKLSVVPESLVRVEKTSGTWIHPELESNLRQWVAEVTTEKKEVTVSELDGIQIELDQFGFMNATAFCVQAKKKYYDWANNKGTRDLMDALKKELAEKGKLDTVVMVYANRRWIHPDLIIPLAEWVFPTFKLQVSRWVKALLSDRSISLAEEEYKFKLLETRQAYEQQIRELADRSVPGTEDLDLNEKLIVYRSLENNQEYIVRRVQNRTAKHSREQDMDVILELDSPNSKELFNRLRERFPDADFKYNRVKLTHGQEEGSFINTLLQVHAERLLPRKRKRASSEHEVNVLSHV